MIYNAAPTRRITCRTQHIQPPTHVRRLSFGFPHVTRLWKQSNDKYSRDAPTKRGCSSAACLCFLWGAARCSVPHRKQHIKRSAPHSYNGPRAIAKSLDKFIHYNQAVGHDAWQGLPRDYNIFTPLGFHHMVDQISVTGDQCAALPLGRKHYCDRFDKEPKSVWQLNTNHCLATMWMLN